MIIEDEEDILTLYKDFLISRGHEVICSSLNANNIMSDFNVNRPDVAIMDYRMSGHKNGIDAAIEILSEYPLFPILFVTGYNLLGKDILSYPLLNGKNIAILVKPVHLKDLENALLNLTK